MGHQFDFNNEHDVKKLILMEESIDDADTEFISILKCFANNSILADNFLSSKHGEVKKKNVYQGKFIRNV